MTHKHIKNRLLINTDGSMELQPLTDHYESIKKALDDAYFSRHNIDPFRIKGYVYNLIYVDDDGYAKGLLYNHEGSKIYKRDVLVGKVLLSNSDWEV